MKHILAATIAATVSANAAISVSLPGTTESAAWTNINAATYSGYGSFGDPTAAWPTSLTANEGTTSAEITKVDGTAGYISGSGFVYDAGAPLPPTSAPKGTFQLTDASPLAGMQTVLLQIDINQVPGTITLSYNGGAQALAPDYFAEGSYGGTYDTRAFQWDLSAAGTITDYTITFVNEAHTAWSRVELATGDSMFQAIPEPSTLLLSLGSSLLLARRRRD